MKLGPISKANREKINDLLNDTNIPKSEYRSFIEEVSTDVDCILDCLDEEEKDE